MALINLIIHWLVVGILIVGLIDGIIMIRNLLAGKPVFVVRERKKKDK